MTNAVVCYSCTNSSKSIAEYFKSNLSYPLFDVYELSEYIFNDLVLVFPVHSQNIPDVVKEFLSKVKTQNLTVIATFGRMCHGNVIHEIQRKYGHNLIAAAYVPTRHSYLKDVEFNDYERLSSIVKKIKNPSPIVVPRAYKNLFSNIMKNFRSRVGVRLYKNDKCNNCGTCNDVCKNNAIDNGVTDRNCIRCLKCVDSCPMGALKYSLRLPMKLYLKKKKKNELVIYI